MEVLTRMKAGENVVVERIQNGQVVGRRKVFINDYIVSLMNELGIGDVLSELIRRDNELSDYLGSVDGGSQLQPFLAKLIEGLPKHELKDSKEYRQLAKSAFEKIDLKHLSPDELEPLLVALISDIYRLPEEPVYVELLCALMSKMLTENTKREVAEKILPKLIKLSKDIDTPLLKEWFEVALPSLDPIWIMETLMRLKDSHEMTVASVEVPSNAVVVKVTTKRNIIAMELPKSQMRVKFHDIAYEEVGHPRLVAVVHIRGNEVMQLKMFAAKSEGPVTKDTQLYKYPYSNVFSDGKVCWNGYVGEEIKSAADIEMLPKVFLSGANNTHLNGDVRSLFEKYQGKEFPDEVLVPFGHTLDQLM